MNWFIGSAGDGGALTGGTIVIVYLVFLVLFIAGLWKTFAKAGEAGWKALIPIYNMIVLLRIVGRPLWWILLMLIPCVGIIVTIIVLHDLSKSFGKGAGFTVGLVLLSPIFIMILGFGDARYVGPAGPEGRQLASSPASAPPAPPPSSPPPPPPPPAGPAG